MAVVDVTPYRKRGIRWTENQKEMYRSLLAGATITQVKKEHPGASYSDVRKIKDAIERGESPPVKVPSEELEVNEPAQDSSCSSEMPNEPYWPSSRPSPGSIVQEALEQAQEAKRELEWDALVAVVDMIHKELDETRLKLEQAAQEPRPTLADQIIEAKKVLRELGLYENPPASDGLTAAIGRVEKGLNDARLEIARTAQALELERKKSEIEAQLRNGDLSLKAAEMNHEHEMKKRAYEDKREENKATLSTISDIASGLAAYLTARGEEKPKVEEKPKGHFFRFGFEWR